jgi:hypothetical protein
MLGPQLEAGKFQRRKAPLSTIDSGSCALTSDLESLPQYEPARTLRRIIDVRASEVNMPKGTVGGHVHAWADYLALWPASEAEPPRRRVVATDDRGARCVILAFARTRRVSSAAR